MMLGTAALTRRCSALGPDCVTRFPCPTRLSVFIATLSCCLLCPVGTTQ
jgi:hypothetical protein